MYRQKPRKTLHKGRVNFLGGINGAARALGVSPRLIRIWMKRGMSDDGAERLRQAWRVARLKRR